MIVRGTLVLDVWRFGPGWIEMFAYALRESIRLQNDGHGATRRPSTAFDHTDDAGGSITRIAEDFRKRMLIGKMGKGGSFRS